MTFEDKGLPIQFFKKVISLNCLRVISLVSANRWMIKVITPSLLVSKVL